MFSAFLASCCIFSAQPQIQENSSELTDPDPVDSNKNDIQTQTERNTLTKGRGKGKKRNQNLKKQAAEEEALSIKSRKNVGNSVNQSTSVVTSDIINSADDEKENKQAQKEPTLSKNPSDSDDNDISTSAIPTLGITAPNGINTLGPIIIEATLVPDILITATDLGVLDDWTTATVRGKTDRVYLYKKFHNLIF